MLNKLRVLLALLCLCLPLAATDFEIIPTDQAGVGFNDTTPVAPLADNPGTTLGEQRINVLARAMEIWGAQLDSTVPITVNAHMDSLPCDETGAALAGANSIYVARGFPNAPDTSISYPSALANAISGSDTDEDSSDINVVVNINLAEDSDCQAFFGNWYYGLDHNNVSGPDLLSVLLHELGHGLGFQSFMNTSTGALFNGRADVYTSNLYDMRTKQGLVGMSSTERKAAILDDPNLVWTGANVTAEAPGTLMSTDGTGFVVVTSPAALARNYAFRAAGFGPAIAADIRAELVVTTPADGCDVLADVTGKIALIDRGDCEFSLKVFAAQSAGAIAVIVADNVEGDLFVMGPGESSEDVVIPSVLISLADGDLLKAAMPGLMLTLGIDPTPGINNGFMRLHAPSPLEGGSSVSHFTEEASPELLMEPVASDDLTDDLDLTIALFKDLGWPTFTASAAVYRLLYPWLSNREGQFDSTLIINNLSDEAVDVVLRARRSSGDALPGNAQIPANGFLEANVRDLFPTLTDGLGFTVEVESNSPNLAGRWVTTSLRSTSGGSPAQGVAAALPVTNAKTDRGKRQVGTSLLYGYLPNQGGVTSAPVIVNAGTAAADVTLYFYNSAGALLSTDTTSVTNLEPYRPFALGLSQLLPGVTENVSMIAYSADQPITGAVFIFDTTFNEPAIGTAQVIDFTP